MADVSGGVPVYFTAKCRICSARWSARFDLPLGTDTKADVIEFDLKGSLGSIVKLECPHCHHPAGEPEGLESEDGDDGFNLDFAEVDA